MDFLQFSFQGGGEKKFKCDWPNCGKAFCHTDNLKVHYRRHTDEKPYKCDKCASSYRQKSGLKYHLEKAHDEKSTGRPGRKRKNASAVGMEEPAQYVPNKWDSQDFSNYQGKESGYGKNPESMKIAEPVQMRFDRGYGPPPPGPNHKNMPGSFHTFYENPQSLMKVKPFGLPHKSNSMKVDPHMSGWNLGKPLHLDGIYQEPVIPGMRGTAPLSSFPGMERGQPESHDFYLPKPSPYCHQQNTSNIVMNYMDEMTARSSSFGALPLMNKSMENEMASSSDDEWSSYQHMKPPILHGSLSENPPLGEQNMVESVEAHIKNEEIIKPDVISEPKSFDGSVTGELAHNKKDFDDLKQEAEAGMESEINVEENKGETSGSSDPNLFERKEKGNETFNNIGEGSNDGEDDNNDQRNSEGDVQARNNKDESTQECLKKTNNDESGPPVDDMEKVDASSNEGNEKISEAYGSPAAGTEKLDKSIEENNSESAWKERDGQNGDMCWGPTHQSHSEIDSLSTSKGWPRVLDASLTESHPSASNENHKSMNIFEPTEGGSPGGGFDRSESYDKMRNTERSSFGSSDYQLANEYSSRHPLLNDNYCFGPSSAANLPYGNVYNFSSNARRAGGCLDAFGSPLFPDRYVRGDDRDYRDPSSLRYNSFLHSSPYPYDPRHYPDNPVMPPGSYDFAYPAGSLPPFPPPPPPPSFSLTRPWTGEFEPISGNESLKSPSASRLYQSSYGQSSSLNRYF